MIPDASAAALQRIAGRADELRHAYQPGFEPGDARAPRSQTFARSLDPLSSVAPPDTWFVFSTPDGVRYGRDGGFTLNGGALRGSDGAQVLGFAVGSQTLGALRVDPIDAALGRISEAKVQADGSVTYARNTLDPRTGMRRSERVELGRIALARFPAGTELGHASATLSVAPAGIAASYGRPGDAGFGALRTSARDLGALDPESGVRRLQEAYLSFEALQAAEREQRGFERVAGDLLK